jgi:hypothetical protein
VSLARAQDHHTVHRIARTLSFVAATPSRSTEHRHEHQDDSPAISAGRDASTTRAGADGP